MTTEPPPEPEPGRYRSPADESSAAPNPSQTRSRPARTSHPPAVTGSALLVAAITTVTLTFSPAPAASASAASAASDPTTCTNPDSTRTGSTGTSSPGTSSPGASSTGTSPTGMSSNSGTSTNLGSGTPPGSSAPSGAVSESQQQKTNTSAGGDSTDGDSTDDNSSEDNADNDTNGTGGRAGEGGTDATAQPPVTTSPPTTSDSDNGDGDGGDVATTSTASPSGGASTNSGDTTESRDSTNPSATSGGGSSGTSNDDGSPGAGAPSDEEQPNAGAGSANGSAADHRGSDSSQGSTGSQGSTSKQGSISSGQRAEQPSGTTTEPIQPCAPAKTDSPRPSVFSMSGGLEGFLPATTESGDVQKGGKNPIAAPSPNVEGREAIKVEVPSGAERSEVQPKAAQDIHPGQHLAFGISDFLAEGFPVDTHGFQVIWQLHDGGTNGSPPVALEISDGHLWLSNVGDHVKDLGRVTAGRNLAVQLDIHFAKGGGTVSVTRDGTPMLTDFKPPKGTMVDGTDYLKTGVYKQPTTGDHDATLFINDEKIGASLDQVGNLNGTT